MPPIPEVEDLLNKIKIIHSKKNEDYTAGGPFENFERSNEIAKWFIDAKDKSYVVLIGTKLARLATLLNSTKSPNNESIEDSFLDLATYCILWGANYAYRQKKAEQLPIQTQSQEIQSVEAVANSLPVQSVDLCSWCALPIEHNKMCINNGIKYHTSCLITKVQTT